MIALKSFIVDQICMVEKRSNDKGDKLLIKNLFDHIEFLKQKLASKDTIIECFDELQVTMDNNDKESEKQLNRNETDSHAPKSIISKAKTKAQTTVILGD